MSDGKPVNYRLIQDRAITSMLEEIVEKHHPKLAEANIALAFQKQIKADKDGHLMLGKCVKVTDLQKEFAAFDFIIVLNEEVWTDAKFMPEKKRALIDHELCHAAPQMDDETGAQKEDERGRLLWRSRKHDIEEFREIVERHGCYKADLEAFAGALLKKQGELVGI